MGHQGGCWLSRAWNPLVRSRVGFCGWKGFLLGMTRSDDWLLPRTVEGGVGEEGGDRGLGLMHLGDILSLPGSSAYPGILGEWLQP